MRRMGQGLAVLVLVLFGLSGCKSAHEQIKPPKVPEEYVLPPQDDKRYSAPIEYPKGTLNQDKQLYRDFVPPGAPGSSAPRTPGSRPGAVGGSM